MLKNGCYILNTAKVNEMFGHFIVLIYDQNRDVLIVWDSLGEEYDFLNILSKNIVYKSQIAIQSKYSILCSLYVIYCLLCVSANKSFQYINSRFSASDLDSNDKNIYIWFLKNDIMSKKILPNFINSGLLDREISEMCI